MQIRIADLDKLAEIERDGHKLTIEDFFKPGNIYRQAALNPNQSVILNYNFQLPPDKDRKDYNIFTLARNGEITEMLRFRRVNGIWRQAFKIMNDSIEPPKLLMQDAEKEFPRNKIGEIDW